MTGVRISHALPLNEYMKFILQIILCAIVLGCSSTLYQPNVGIDWSHHPADWPKLTIVEHIDQPLAVNNTCIIMDGIIENNHVYLGCAVIDFNKMTCDVWINEKVNLNRARRHEEDGHCNGYDHPGRYAIENAWIAWKKLHR